MEFAVHGKPFSESKKLDDYMMKFNNQYARKYFKSLYLELAHIEKDPLKSKLFI